MQMYGGTVTLEQSGCTLPDAHLPCWDNVGVFSEQGWHCGCPLNGRGWERPPGHIGFV